MNTSELRQKGVAELRQEMTSLLREQFNLRMQKGTGQLTRTHQLSRVRRAIARLNTVLGEKQA
jgi:large subunit ribosomal protein L29